MQDKNTSIIPEMEVSSPGMYVTASGMYQMIVPPCPVTVPAEEVTVRQSSFLRISATAS